MQVVLTVSSPPHIYGKDTTARRMLDVLIALIPATILGIYFYGISAFFVISISILSAVAFEFLFQKVTGKTNTVNDLSAVITGLLLAFNLPPDVPLWIPIVGSGFAIIVVKQLFGGLGSNFMNPALAARAFLLASFPIPMTTWRLPVDTVSGATYLAMLSENRTLDAAYRFVPQTYDYMALLFGRVGGCIGETSALALVAGGLYLIARRVISWRIPVFYIGSFAFFAFVFGREAFFSGHILFEVMAGGLLLGAFFMATDYATAPISPNGKIIMGIGCGFLTVLIRFFGGFPEGVSYAILIMNLFVPLIDAHFRPAIYGKKKKKA
ncbi:MAG: RnfABCDGE type electron transport complex subunit D [Spirochaetes bacterium]|nr:RnfABCDGE type electron transport complex subunit D [Spirochaetota bacterium]